MIDLSLPLGVLVTVSLRNRIVGEEFNRARAALDAQTVALESERQSRHEKRMLLDMMTHEIKNPLAAINFAVTTLAQSHEDQQGQTPRRLENIALSVETIDQVIERCNLASGIEDERFAPRFTHIDLTRLLRELIDTTPDPSRLYLTTDEVFDFRSDAYLLKVVAANLIDNALKYAKRDTSILVEPFSNLAQGQETFGFRVVNEVDPNLVPDPQQVFQRYYRHPLAQRLRGSGLGLSICRQICQLLGGPSPTAAMTARSPSRSALHPLEALAIVEDDAILREELRCFFDSQGFVVHEANSYPSLLEILKFHPVQVVVLDLNLPGKNGFEIATLLKKDLPRLGVVMLTARTALHDRIKSYDAGADIYLPKPTDPMELLAATRSLVKRLQEADAETEAFQLSVPRRRLVSADVCCEDLTAAEVLILRALAISPDQTLNIGELLDVLEDKFAEKAVTRRAFENILSRLRKKLMTCFDSPLDPIKAVRGFGYQLTWSIDVVD